MLGVGCISELIPPTHVIQKPAARSRVGKGSIRHLDTAARFELYENILATFQYALDFRPAPFRRHPSNLTAATLRPELDDTQNTSCLKHEEHDDVPVK